MSDESLWALADWSHAFADTQWMTYKALVIVAIVVFVALIVAEIVNLLQMKGGKAMNERMFVMGLLIGVVSLIISVAVCITMEVMGYGNWVLTLISVIVLVALAALAGFACGLNCE